MPAPMEPMLTPHRQLPVTPVPQVSCTTLFFPPLVLLQKSEDKSSRQILGEDFSSSLFSSFVFLFLFFFLILFSFFSFSFFLLFSSSVFLFPFSLFILDLTCSPVDLCLISPVPPVNMFDLTGSPVDLCLISPVPQLIYS